MNKISFLFLLAIFNSASLVNSAPARVYSGEHENFTRIVVENRNIEISEENMESNTYEVSFRNVSEGLNLERVFEKIPKTRVKEVHSTESKMTISLDCNCTVNASQYGSNAVVIDISNSSNIGVVPNDRETEASNSQTVEFSEPARRLDPVVETRNSFKVNHKVDVKKAFEAELETDASKYSDDELSGIRESLLENFSRATTNGLLRKNTDRLMASLDKKVEEHSAEIQVDSNPANVAPSVAPLSENFRIQSSETADGDSLMDSLSFGRENADGCSKDVGLDVKSWSSEAGFLEVIPALESGLYRDTGLVDEDVAKRLMSAYMFFGFWDEALNVSELILVETASLSYLKNVSRLMNEDIKENRELSKFANCEDFKALWGILAASELQKESSVEVDSALLAVNSLPKHLREEISPKLSEKLLSLGYPTPAKDALRLIERVVNVDTDSVDYLNSLIELETGNIDQTVENLEAIAESTSDRSADALIRLVEKKMNDGESIDVETSVLVNSYLHEFDGSEVGDDLKVTYVLSLAKSGQFLDSFSELSNLSELNRVDIGSVQNSILDILVSEANNSKFIEAFFSEKFPDLHQASSDVRYSIVERLVEIGFLHEAKNIIEFVSEGKRTEKAKLLMSDIAVKLGDYGRAGKEILDLEGSEVRKIRASVLSNEGRLMEAAREIEVDDQGRSNELIWMSQNWESHMDGEDERFGAFVKLAREQVKFDEEQENLLEQSENILSQSNDVLNILSDPLLSLNVFGE